MTVKRDCSGKIWGAYRDVSGRVYKCSRNATVKHDGKWYCWQHDPRRVKADKEKRRAADEAKMDGRAAMWKRRTRNAKLAALVTPELAGLLERLASIIDSRRGPGTAQTTYTARALAARIREVLEVNDESA